MPLVLRLTAPQTAIYRSWNDTGHGSCVSIFGPGGAKVTAVAHRQTAIYRAVYKINPCCRSLDQTARILCIDMRVSLQPLFLAILSTCDMIKQLRVAASFSALCGDHRLPIPGQCPHHRLRYKKR